MARRALAGGYERVDSSSGTQPKRRSLSRRRSADATAVAAEASTDPPAPPSDQVAQARPPETADIYRSLLNELRRTFGGTVDDSNADAIAFAASELYHKDVEPRLWEQKSAQEILDGFGVPRAGAFNRYSLTDRLLLLRRSASPDRTEQAHALLTTLGAPETDQGGSRHSLKERLEWLLVEVAPLPASGLRSPPPSSPPSSPADGAEPDQLVEALRTIQHAVGSEDSTDASIQAPPPAAVPAGVSAADLAGLGTVIGGIQEELIRLRQAVEAVQGCLEETLQLLRAGDLAVAPPIAPPVGGPIAPPPIAASMPTVLEPESPAAAADEPDGSDVPVEALDADPEPSDPDAPPSEPPASEPAVAGPDDVTQAVPVIPAIEGEEAPAAPAGRRRRSLPKLLVIAVVLGLLVAGVAIAISAVGWSEMRNNLDIGWAGVLADLVAYAAAPGTG